MVDLLMDGRSRTHDWHYSHVGELLFSFFMVQSHLDPGKNIRLWHNQSGRLIAYSIFGEDPSFDFQVLPEYEWTGIEAEAFCWAKTCLVQLRQNDPGHYGGVLVSGARQDDTRRIEFLEQHGFQYKGRFAEVNLLRSLEKPIPCLEIPPGYRVTSMAEMDNIPDRAAVQREVWQPWTVGNVTDQDYLHFMQLPGYESKLDIVTLTPDGVIAAYANCWIDPLNLIGDIGPVGAREAYRQRGLTRLALLESLRRLKARKMERVCISTGVNNIPALELYQSIGFEICNHYLDYEKIYES